MKKSEARALYDDVTPKPTPEEIEMRRVERVYRAAAQAAGTPDRNHRREIRRLKESGRSRKLEKWNSKRSSELQLVERTSRWHLPLTLPRFHFFHL